jgi:hypothetical protein
MRDTETHNPNPRRGSRARSAPTPSRILPALAPPAGLPLTVLFFALFLSPPAVAAQETAGARSSPTLEVVERRGGIEIDGRLSEAGWERAPASGGFVQGDPREGAAPARSTEVRVLYDDEAIYVGARMHDDGPAAIADQLVRRDESGQYDFFEVLLDTNLDRQTAYLFRVSASGVERDAVLTRDTREDVDWDAVWTSAVRIDSAGWSVELRIPLSQVRYESHDEPQTWGVNFRRRRLASSSTSYFSLVSRTTEGVVSQSGHLTGVLLTDTERRFEVEPFVATQLHRGPVTPGDPFFDGSEVDVRAGANVRYGVGSAFSLDATVNPDFGQVEVDPAVVNLSAFETFFSEKRPFFVQDAQVFDFDLSSRNGRMFFSRRIGREPHREAIPGAQFREAPDRTTILGAGKLTGRTKGGLSVGVLGAVTQEETGRAVLEGSGEVREFVAEPASRYGVARVQQDFRGGASRIGALLTGMSRSLPADGVLDRLPSSAFGAAIDVQHQWGGARDRRWSVFGYVAGTHVRGTPEAMVEIQTNPQHYYQRPDADDLSVDSTATHLTGVNWNVGFARQSGEHWTWSVELEQLSPDFSVNDLGFISQGEQFDLEGDLSYREITPGSLFRSWGLSFFTFHELRHELLDDIWSAGQWARAYKGGQFSLNGDFELHSNWTVDVGFDYGPRTLSDTETRGGPLMAQPAFTRWEAELVTDPRRTLSLRPEVGFTERYSGGGSSLELALGATLRPSPGFELSLVPAVEFRDDAAQFVAVADDPTYGPTFGRRYLFAGLERTELSLETRLGVTFTPDLSLQLFLQPLISAGDFGTYRQLERPSSFAFRAFDEGTAVSTGGGVVCDGGATCVADGTRHIDFDGDGAADFSLPVQDFNLRSIRGNAVLRWEYRPGSTLFLVWQQDRRDEVARGDVRLGRDLEELLTADAADTFILKISHYLDL